MSQEPWKRAYQLSAMRKGPQPGGPDGRPPRPKIGRGRNWCGIILLAGILLVLGVAVAAYFTRGWWFPRYRQQLPQQVEQAIVDTAPEPRIDIDYRAFETGLGIELLIFGDYLDVLNAANDWGVDWKLTDTGAGTQRIVGEGLRIYVKQGRISSYEIELAEVFASGAWQPWQEELRRAGLSPDTTWTAVTGEAEMPPGIVEREIHSGNDVKVDGGWAHAVWELYFRGGWLTRIVGGMEVGAADWEGGDGQPTPSAPDAG